MNKDENHLYGLSLTPEYFNIYCYIADQQNIEVKLNVDSPFAGTLDQQLLNQGIIHLSAGMSMTTTLAAASALKEYNYAEIEVPKLLTKKGFVYSLKDSLTKEACCILDLSKISSVFFEYHISVCYLINDEQAFTLLYNILRQRIRTLQDDLSINSINEKFRLALPTELQYNIITNSAKESNLGKNDKIEKLKKYLTLSESQYLFDQINS